MTWRLERDERESDTDRAADRLSYPVLAFGLLVVAAYHGLVGHESAFDLLVLVVASGFVGLGYRVLHRTATSGWFLMAAGAVVLAAIAAAAVAVALR